jgi:hypothetical protein
MKGCEWLNLEIAKRMNVCGGIYFKDGHTSQNEMVLRGNYFITIAWLLEINRPVLILMLLMNSFIHFALLNFS